MFVERYHYPKCYLSVGGHKTIDSSICLEIATASDDQYAPETDAEFVKSELGVRAMGELSFEAYPLRGSVHPVRKNAVGTLTVLDDGLSSKFNVVFIEKNSDQDIIKDRLKRYFWLFFVVGRPSHDALEIFPEWYRGKIVNKVFVCTDFRGIWPVGVSSVVVAPDRKRAKILLMDILVNAGISQPEIHSATLQEVDLLHSQALLLNKGEY
jgi:hypothetical protein